MSWRRWCVPLTASLAVALVGCGTGATAKAGPSIKSSASITKVPASPHMTAPEIATKLAPLGCVTAPPPTSTVGIGEIKPVTLLECTISGESVTIDGYPTAHQVWYNSQLPGGAGCTKGWGATELFYVAGPNWLVTPKTAGTAKVIHKALGFGAVFGLEC